MFLASGEAVLRPRSGFNVPSESPWVELSNGIFLVLLRWKLSPEEMFVKRGWLKINCSSVWIKSEITPLYPFLGLPGGSSLLAVARFPHIHNSMTNILLCSVWTRKVLQPRNRVKKKKSFLTSRLIYACGKKGLCLYCNLRYILQNGFLS